MRGDLPRGVAAAQLIHAAGRSATPAVQNARAVALVVRDEHQLIALERRLLFEEIEHVAVREPDPPWNGALMAIGLKPTNSERAAALLRRYRLLR